MIQVINRALDIIEYVTKEPERPKLLGEMANQLQLNPATCANIVKTLLTRGYLEKHYAKGYLPGKQLQHIAENATNHRDVIEAADKPMTAASKKLKENTLLAVLRGDMRIVIHKKNAEQVVQAQTPDEKKAWDSSTGRLLICMLDELSLEEFIGQYGLPPASLWKDASSKNKLIHQATVIKKQGYAIIEDSSQITGVAVPIYKKGKVVASFSIYLPSFRCSAALRKQIITQGIAAGRSISKALAQA